MLSAIMFSVKMLIVIIIMRYVIMLSGIILRIIMRSGIMLRIIMLSGIVLSAFILIALYWVLHFMVIAVILNVVMLSVVL